MNRLSEQNFRVSCSMMFSFDKYLLGRKLEDEKFEQTFYSFLFDQTPIKTSLTQEVTTDEETGLKKISRYISADDQRTKVRQ